jgi:hypothetical protein
MWSLAAACIDPIHGAVSDAHVAMSITAGAARSTSLQGVESVDVTVNYARADRSVIRLASQSLPYIAGPQSVTINVNVASCVSDDSRTPPGPGCPLFVRVILRDALGAVIDSAQSSAVPVTTGQSVAAPAVSFLRVATVSVVLPRPAWSVGDTGTVSASTRDTAGAAVSATVRWRSDNPAVITVDSVTGRFSAVSTGVATIIVNSQGKEARQAVSIGSAPANARCRGSGHTVIDTAQYRAPIAFNADGSPYWMADGAVFVRARIEIPAGVTLCTGRLAVGADLGGYIRAIGTATQPITFTPLNDLKSALFIALGGTPTDSSRFEHVVFDRGGDSSIAVVIQAGAGSSHPTVLSHVRFRQSLVPRAILATSGSAGVRVSDVTVDTTGATLAPGDGSPAFQAAVTVNQLSIVERTTIRGAGRNGFEVVRTSLMPSSLRIATLGIDDASLDGYVTTSNLAEPITASGVRVSRAGRYPVSVVAPHFARVFSTLAAQQAVIGSARDTAIIGGGQVLKDTLRAFGVLPWRFVGSSLLVDSGSVFEAFAGASIEMAPGSIIGAQNRGRLFLLGNPSQPVRLFAATPSAPWIGIQLSGGTAYVASADSSVLSNVEIEGAGASDPFGVVLAQHRLVAEGIKFRKSPALALYLLAARSRVTGALFDSVGGSLTNQRSYSLFVGADSITIRRVLMRGARGNGIGIGTVAVRGVVLDSSTITGSAGAGLVTGIQLGVAGLSLSALNLFGNGAQSLRIDGANQVDARNLWWGSASGPLPGQATGNVITLPVATSAFNILGLPAQRSGVP